MKLFQSIIHSMLISVTMLTIVCFIIYISVQQVYRTNADDPQVQLAEEASNQMMSGTTANAICGEKKIDIASSLSPFINIYNEAGDPVAGTGMLDGTVASIPKGVFEIAKSKGKNAVTWQPRKGVRSAIIVYYFKSDVSGFAVSGRSLRETENRIGNLINQLLFGWAIAIAVIFVVTFLGNSFFKKKAE